MLEKENKPSLSTSTINKTNIDIHQISSPETLLEYLTSSKFSYGYININGEKKFDLKDRLKDYKINSFDEVYQNKLGTCIGMTLFEHEVFKKIGFNSKCFCTQSLRDSDKLDNPIIHCFALCETPQGHCHFDYTHPVEGLHGVHYYLNENEALKNIMNKIRIFESSYYKIPQNEFRILSDITNIKAGLSWREFIEYIQNENHIKIQ